MPGVGEYGLEIYANNPETDGQSLRHVYQFLVICHKLSGDSPAPYPVLPASYLGPQPGSQSLGLVSDIEDPYIVTDTSELAVSFVASKRVRLTAQLIGITDTASEDRSHYILQQAVSEQLIKFIVRLPKLGTYKLQAGFLQYLDSLPCRMILILMIVQFPFTSQFLDNQKLLLTVGLDFGMRKSIWPVKLL